MVQRLVAVDVGPVDEFQAGPTLLLADSSKLRSSSYVPDGLDVDLRSGNQLLDFLGTMDLGIIPHHGKFDTGTYLGTHLL